MTELFLKTNRLIIRTASCSEMKSFIEAQTDDILKTAYQEMLDGAAAHPDMYEWYALWMIELPDGTHVGELSFKGMSDDGVVEIGYGIVPEFRNNGYATEAVSAVARWAFTQPLVRCVEAECEEENAASKRVLIKSGFIPTGVYGDEGPRFRYAG